MSYLVLARKYRPAGFDDFVGQEVVAETLRNAIRLGRVGHAYLFCGPRGVGKTSMARVFAKALNCKQGPTENPCGKCPACKAIGTGDDVDVIEIDGASNRGINEVREIRQNTRYAASRSRFKIYTIDEVHMLTEPAFNALLKTLEEPPSHVKFFMATTAPAKLPETILSRVQRFDFRRIATGRIADRLKSICEKEKVSATDEVCLLIARRGRGSMRDALSLLDQVFSFCGENPEIEDVTRLIGALDDDEMGGILDKVRGKDSAGLVRDVGHLLMRGMDAGEIVDEMVHYLRDLLIGRVCGADQDLLDRPAESAAQIVERGRDMTPEHIIYMIEVLNAARRRLREEQDERIVLELALVKLAESDGLRPVGELIERLAALQDQVGLLPGPAGPPPGRQGLSASRAQAPSGSHARFPTAAGSRSGRDLEDGNGPGRAAPVIKEESPLLFTPAGEKGGGVWEQLLQAAHMKSSWLYVCLHNGRLERIADGEAVVAFAKDRAKFRADLNRPENRKIIEELLAGILGSPVKVCFTVLEEGPADAPTESRVVQDEMIQEIVRRFDGQIIRGS